ncbi:MAG: 4-hydroxy-tetrahydrodipicolinate synthase [Fimbriimonadaceae bacterium]|nr:4-hydroxy-tetrahydrodipicolinate synthase [Fimbriimonadaceae bacterium]
MPAPELLPSGVYPAAITPFDTKGRIDVVQSAKLMAWFEAAGCQGVVLAGTNGEGPSLSAVEKRDQIRDVQTPLRRILGIATPSLDEAIWLSKRAHEFGASAILVMPPAYFRTVSETGIADWFLALLDASPLPTLAYNFPKMTGITLTPVIVGRLAQHDCLAGLKDSSGERENLVLYRELLPNQSLFVGDETLLWDALEAGWTGTISGAANLVAKWLATIIDEYRRGGKESAKTKFDLLLPALKAIRSGPQPALNKGILARWGILDSDRLRLPLQPAASERLDEAIAVIEAAIGKQV